MHKAELPAVLARSNTLARAGLRCHTRTMRRRSAVAFVSLLLALGTARPAPSWTGAGDAFSFFSPTIRVSPDDWRDLRAGRMVIRTLPHTRPDHTGVFVAAPITVTPDRFVERVRRSAELWRGSKVPASGTFSVPPRAADVRELVLRNDDLRAIDACRPGRCDIKLAGPEMERLRGAAAQTNGDPGAYEAVQIEFREVVLDRMRSYHQDGLRGLPAPQDHTAPVDLHDTFTQLLRAMVPLTRDAPQIAEYFQRYPEAPLPPGTERFSYWLETSETPKPTIQVLHVVIERRQGTDPVEVLVVSRQVFATHYLNGGLAITALLRDPADPSRRYLGYMNISAVDGLGGFFSGIKRFFVERRIRGAARSAFELFRQRIEA